jgi:hypothetical protein
MPTEEVTCFSAKNGLGVLLSIILTLIVTVTESAELIDVLSVAKSKSAAKSEIIAKLHEPEFDTRSSTSGILSYPAKNAVPIVIDDPESNMMALLAEGRELLDSGEETLVQQDDGNNQRAEQYSLHGSTMKIGEYEIGYPLVEVGENLKSCGPFPGVRTSSSEGLIQSPAASVYDPCHNVSSDGATKTLCRTENSFPIFNISFIQRMGLLGIPCRTLCLLPPTYVSPRLFSEGACEKSCESILTEPCMNTTCTRTMCPPDTRFVTNACKNYCSRVLRQFGSPGSLLFIQRYWAFQLCEACLRVYPYSGIPDCSWAFELWTPVAANGSQQYADTCRVRGRFTSSDFDNSRVLEYV